MSRVFALGKINRALFKYDKISTLSPLDTRLLKGFYVADKWELDSQEEIKFASRKDVEDNMRKRIDFEEGDIKKSLLKGYGSVKI
jgi:hypothetical protein